MAEKLELTREEALDLLDGDTEEFKIVKDEMVDKSRWSIVYELVVQRISDGKFFMDTYSRGATECQEERPWEYTEPDFREVVAVEKITYDYQEVKN